MSIKNESMQSYKCDNESPSFNNSYKSNQSVSENSQKNSSRCFVDFLHRVEDDNDANEDSIFQIENLNLSDNLNQSNIYFKPKRKQPKFLHDIYLTGDTIGRGSYGKVKDSIDIRTLKRYAIKIVCKMKIKKIPGGMNHVESEISIMKILSHDNIVKLIDEFTEFDPVRRCIVLEFCVGSIHDLQTNGINECSNQFRCLPEWQAHGYFVQIINGIQYLHSQRIVHKDLKPGNFLLTEQEIVKITDFGVSEKFDVYSFNSYITGGHTTPAIQSPELAGGQHQICGYKLDIYGAGVSLYFMLCGRLPFQNNNLILIFDEIVAGIFTIPTTISQFATDLIKMMMNKNVKERFNLKQILRHEWLLSNHQIVEQTKVEPLKYLKYSCRNPSNENLYILSSSLMGPNQESLQIQQSDGLSDFSNQIPVSNPIIPLTIMTRLRTYYDWPMTMMEEKMLYDDQLIIGNDYICYDEPSVLDASSFQPEHIESNNYHNSTQLPSEIYEPYNKTSSSTDMIPRSLRISVSEHIFDKSNINNDTGHKHDGIINISNNTTTDICSISRKTDPFPITSSSSSSNNICISRKSVSTNTDNEKHSTLRSLFRFSKKKDKRKSSTCNPS